MKISIQTPLVATVAALVGFASPAVADTDCEKVSSEFASALSKKPDDLLILLHDAVSKNQSCACEIVKAAIKAVGADKAKVGDIVSLPSALLPRCPRRSPSAL